MGNETLLCTADFPLTGEPIFDVDLTKEEDNSSKEVPLQHMGDLMGWRTTFCPLPEGFSPLERMVLTANGNLQRLISSFYNSAVEVRLVYNKPIGIGKYDRKVELAVFDKVFCVATSHVTLTSEDYVHLVEEQKAKGVSCLINEEFPVDLFQWQQ